MNLTDAIPRDDLLLAQLAVAKLAGVMHGVLSVGAASLELESPTEFVSSKEKVLLGFTEVLRCIGVKPGHADKVELLRRHVDHLSQRISQFHVLFLRLCQWRSKSPEETREMIDRLAVSYTEFWGSLGAFASLLGMDADYSTKAAQGRAIIDGLFTVLQP